MDNNNPYPYKRLLLLPVAIVIFFIIFKIDQRNIDLYNQKLSSEYYFIRFKDSVNDKVVSVFIPDRIRSPQTSFINTIHQGKIEIWAEPVEQDLRLPEVMQIGSHIEKRMYDSIILVTNITGRDTLRYKFKMLNFKTLTYTPEKWEKPTTP
ncbi:MAG: hypothetical protein RBQ64_07165 [Candidatus Izemoplasmatales bacterium]|jgi:hypothetical protein|nr:hypothetical protein [Candidatus Izemoplasmatales bacterium]